MTPTASAANRFPSNADLVKSLPRYSELLTEFQMAKKATGANHDLSDLDHFVWSELGSRVKARSLLAAKGQAVSGWVELDELQEIMRWKLARGKFRPTLPSLIFSNSKDKVKFVTQRAFGVLANGNKRSRQGEDTSLESLPALKILSELRGVGPATASLLLSIVSPSSEGFMSDESWLCLPGLANRKLGYSEADWKRWRKEWEGRLEEWQYAHKKCENIATSARDMEKAMWAWSHRSEDDEPKGDESKEQNLNASTTAKRKRVHAAANGDSIHAFRKARRQSPPSLSNA